MLQTYQTPQSFKDRLISELHSKLSNQFDKKMEYSQDLLMAGVDSRSNLMNARNLETVLNRIVWLENMIDLVEEMED